MKRMHIWLATQHYNFVAWMWKRHHQNGLDRPFPPAPKYAILADESHDQQQVVIENCAFENNGVRMATERVTHVTFENDEANASVASNGKSYVLLKRVCATNRASANPFRGDFIEFAEFDKFVEALVEIRTMVAAEMAATVSRETREPKHKKLCAECGLVFDTALGETCPGAHTLPEA